MQELYPFAPNGAIGTTPTAQTTLAVSAAVQQVTLPIVPQGGCTMRLITDGGTGIAWAAGTAGSMTINNGCFQMPNTTFDYSVPSGVTQISVIGASAAGTLRIILGHGKQ